jgi:hypothetical protein
MARVIKSRKSNAFFMRHSWEIQGNVYKSLVGTFERRRQLKRSRARWKVNYEWDLKIRRMGRRRLNSPDIDK